MRIAHFDCFSGASGDMILGALISSGWPKTDLEATLAKLPVAEYGVSVSSVSKQGIAATQVSFALPNEPHSRRLADLFDTISRSMLSQEVKDGSLAVLRLLGSAEAKVHGLDVPPEEVRLHELGSLDTVFDIVGAVAGLAALGVEVVSVSPLNLGGGKVKTAHGSLAVPVPAVAELVQGLPVVGGEPGDGELVTPTAAALLKALASRHGALPPMFVRAVGYGAGQRDRDVPNVLRLWLGDVPDSDETRDEVVLVETNLDDMSPELCAPLLERLFSVGVLDAYWQPIVMKKGRPGILLGVIGLPDQLAVIEEAIFTETTTLGVRHHVLQRRKLRRDVVKVDTQYGQVGVKLGWHAGKIITVAPEFEDCLRLARERGVPARHVYDAAKLAYSSTYR